MMFFFRSLFHVCCLLSTVWFFFHKLVSFFRFILLSGYFFFVVGQDLFDFFSNIKCDASDEFIEKGFTEFFFHCVLFINIMHCTVKQASKQTNKHNVIRYSRRNILLLFFSIFSYCHNIFWSEILLKNRKTMMFIFQIIYA